jgi:hypothetical protein
MSRWKFRANLIIVALLMVSCQFATSEISYNECEIEKELSEEEVMSVASVDKSQPVFNKKIPKKSLLIVFDGTNSMTDDLDQMRSAAKEIMTYFYERPDRPIKNYILSVFRDPSRHFFSTKINSNFL